uniref:Uncharacterized protein n=1 Tax=Arundo donax TaxID=35708 RepID=A0A0A9BWQ8_ARUDO
MLEFTELTVTL